MHPILEKFFNEKEMEERKKREKEKEELLISNELFEKVYSDKDECSFEFSCYDQAEQKWYKRKLIDVTDEEYEKIKKYYLKSKEIVVENGDNTGVVENSNNTISIVLKVVAWIVFVVGFFMGIVKGLSYWRDSFISGILLLGLSEIMRLLNDIKNK